MQTNHDQLLVDNSPCVCILTFEIVRWVSTKETSSLKRSIYAVLVQLNLKNMINIINQQHNFEVIINKLVGDKVI